jgi:hypothetical protein
MLTKIAAGEMNEEIMAKAQEMLDKMAEEKEKRAVKVAEKAEEVYAPYISKFVSVLGEEPRTATDILTAFEGYTAPSGKPVSVQFISSIGGKAVAQGLAEKIDVKISGKGTQKGYRAVVAD